MNSKTTWSWLAGDQKACADKSFNNNGACDEIHVCSSRGGKSIARKSHVSGAQGSFELNINSSLCFRKNSQK